MEKAHYTVEKRDQGWVVVTDGVPGEVEYVTKESAFEALIIAADRMLAEEVEIDIHIPGGIGRWGNAQ